MSVLTKFTIDKQLESYAKDWYFEKESFDDSIESQDEIFDSNRDFIVNDYLKKHPKVKEQYKEKCKKINKIGILSALGAIGAVTITSGVLCLSGCGKGKDKQNTNTNITQIEQESTSNNSTEINPYEEMYNVIFNNIKDLDDVNDIHNYTKQTILTCYNRENPDNKIYDFGIIISEPSFLTITRDNLGNITSYKIGPNDTGAETVKGRTVYSFLNNSTPVACYDKDGTKILNDKIKHEADFSKYVDLVNKSEKLKYMYAYRSNDNEKLTAKKEYAESIVNTLYPNLENEYENENNYSLE